MAVWANLTDWIKDTDNLSLIVAGFALIFTWAQARAARQALNQEHRSRRPYVYFFKTKKVKTSKGIVLRLLGVTFRNVGETAAYVEQMAVDTRLAIAAPRPEEAILEVYPPSHAIIPSEEWPLKGYTPITVSGDDFTEQTPEGPLRLFAFGQMIYRDSFGRRYRLRFCRVYHAGSFAYDRALPDLYLPAFNSTVELTTLRICREWVILSGRQLATRIRRLRARR